MPNEGSALHVLTPGVRLLDACGFVEAKIQKIESKIPYGCNPLCRGCRHRGLSTAESTALKEGWLRRTLAPWADRIAPIRSADESGRWGYRERVCLSTAWTGAAWAFGLRAREDLIPIPECPVHAPRVRAAVRILSAALPPGPVFPMVYYVQSGAQAVLVLKTRQTPDIDWLTTPVRQELASSGLEGLWLHLNPSAGKRVLAKRDWVLLWGTPQSVDEQGMVYGPGAFQQLIPALCRQALDEAEAFLSPGPDDLVADLYSGIGTSLRRWFRRDVRTVGVELGGDAVACASVNAPGALVLRGTCTDRIPQLHAWAAEHAASARDRLLYVNPPRTGIEPAVLCWIREAYRPGRIAYLSCSAGTLRRDLEALGDGHEVARITPYDFFPHTHHVETLVLIQARHLPEDIEPT